MVEVVYIQTDNGLPFSPSAYNLLYGCKKLGINYRFFENEELPYLIYPETVVHGGIKNVLQALNHLNVTPVLPNAPEELLPWFGRKIWHSTLGEMRNLPIDTGKLFIKPIYQKLFVGHVIEPGNINSLIKTASYEDDSKILVSEVVQFISEYRLFVHNDTIIGCSNYCGDFTKTINFEVANQIIGAFKSAPVAYSLDLDLTQNGNTLIVEINDAYSLGCYDLPPIPYTKMVIDRWKELVIKR